MSDVLLWAAKAIIGLTILSFTAVAVWIVVCDLNRVDEVDLDLDDQPECCPEHEQQRAELDRLEHVWRVS